MLRAAHVDISNCCLQGSISVTGIVREFLERLLFVAVFLGLNCLKMDHRSMETGLLFQFTKTGLFILMNILVTIVWISVVPTAPQHNLIAQKYPPKTSFNSFRPETSRGKCLQAPAVLLYRAIHLSTHPDKQTKRHLSLLHVMSPARPEIVHHFPLHQYVFLYPLRAFGQWCRRRRADFVVVLFVVNG